ncbi:efflux RND transporter periplasmic adaptor subunit [Bermanella sp. R86510]|uniref:efflux RND transporter periplasmic adaptor subunit n=1 Tax=unclassified Bermanella TaxID=2627862 RepID=UPI0037CB6F3B
MGRFFYGLLWVALAGLSACSSDDTNGPEKEVAKVVQLAEVKIANQENEFSFPAKVVAKTTANMAFQVSGRLDEINLPEGQVVKQGEVLARLDAEPFKRAVRTAQVRVKQAKLELDRVKAIAEKGIGSAQSVDNAQVAYDLAQLDLENARQNLEYSVLKAPFNGVVAKRLIENEGFIATGSPVARIQDLSKIHFEFDVPERLISRYSRNQIATANAYIDGSVNKEFPITYVEHSTEPDPVTQTYKVTYAMSNDGNLDITPGVRATINIVGNRSSQPEVLGVPVSAIVTSPNDNMYVWLYNPDTQRISKQTVTTGPMLKGYVAVLAGLEKGQQVVSAGATKLEDGMLVRPFKMQ